jgi:hypothetical protein
MRLLSAHCGKCYAKKLLHQRPVLYGSFLLGALIVVSASLR